MTLKTHIIALLFAICVTEVCADAKPWRGLIPLVSTRADVERVLGAPKRPCKMGRCSYETKDERVEIDFSLGPCPKGDPKPFNVPRDTVVEIDVTFKNRLPLADFHLDLSEYEKTEDPHIFEISYYGDHEEGVTYVVDGSFLREVFYTPTARDEFLYLDRRCTVPDRKGLDRYGTPCPTVAIESKTKVAKPGAIVTFNAKPARLDPTLIPLYKWTVSAGIITGPQDTSLMKLDTHGVRDKSITITVEVVGFPSECPKPPPFILKIRR